jgi:hypothetical protein
MLMKALLAMILALGLAGATVAMQRTPPPIPECYPCDGAR